MIKLYPIWNEIKAIDNNRIIKIYLEKRLYPNSERVYYCYIKFSSSPKLYAGFYNTESNIFWTPISPPYSMKEFETDLEKLNIKYEKNLSVGEQDFRIKIPKNNNFVFIRNN